MVASPQLSPTGFAQYLQPKRGGHIFRILAVASSLTILIFIFSTNSFVDSWPSSHLYPTAHVNSTITQSEDTPKPQIADGAGPVDWAKSSDQVAPPPSTAPATSSDQSEEKAVEENQAQKEAVAVPVRPEKPAATKAPKPVKPAAEESVAEKPKNPIVQGQPGYYNVHNGKPYNFEQSLQGVLTLLPDEIYTRDLLKPITGGGEERLREVGLRARLFSKYFGAWEGLHVVSDGSKNGAALVRDDIIKNIRDSSDLSGISSAPRAEMTRSYEEYRSFMAKFAAVLFPWTAPYFADHMSLHAQSYSAGKGIATTGNDDVAPYMVTALMSFRELGCNLPIEVFYLGDNDLGDEFREQLEAIPGVTTRDLKKMVADKGWDLAGWASKAFSILMCSFREVIFVDADVLFFRNPEFLFEDPQYTDTGALFFYDRLMSPTLKQKFLRKAMPKPVSAKARTSRWWTGEGTEMQESGVIVVDKWKHFVSLLVITRMNGPDRDDRDGNKGVYSFFYGDKETFWLGFELAGDTDYSFHAGNAGTMGVIDEVEISLTGEQMAAKFIDSGQTLPPELVPFAPHSNTLVIPDGDGNTGSTEPDKPHVIGEESDSDSDKDKPPKKIDSSESAKDRLEQAKEKENKADDDDDDEDRPGRGQASKEDSSSSSGKDKDSKKSDKSSDDKSSKDDKSKDSKKEKSKDNKNDDSKDTKDSKSSKDDKDSKSDSSKSNKNDEEEREITESSSSSDSSSDSSDSSDSSSDVGSSSSSTNDRRNPTPLFFRETVSAENYTWEDLSTMTPANFSMWSPQLLHLSTSNTPLWFNGWIQKSKWFHDKHVEVSKWEYYLSERRQGGGGKERVDGGSDTGLMGEWGIYAENMGKLKSDKVFKFSEEELRTLDMIVGIAKKVGAVD